MRLLRKLTGILLVTCLSAGLLTPTLAAEPPGNAPAGHVTMSMERFVLGQGYLLEPMEVPYYEGDNIAGITQRFVGEGNYKSKGNTDAEFYLSYVNDGATSAFAQSINPPQYILNALQAANPASSPLQDMIGRGRVSLHGVEWLGELDYSKQSGWMYTQNNVFNDYGVSQAQPADGDVIRWQYSIFGYGRDLGTSTVGGSPIVTPADRDRLTRLIGQINAADNKDEILMIPGMQAALDHAYGRLADLEAPQPDIGKAYDDITALLNQTPTDPDPDPDPGELVLLLTSPDQIAGASGTEFNLVVGTKGWTERSVKLLDGIINIPEGLEVVEATVSENLSGGALNHHLDTGKLRFAYLSEQDLQDLAFSADGFPADLFTLRLRLTRELAADTELSFTAERASLKESSDKDELPFDITVANSKTVALSSGAPASAVSRILYQGDDSDLIPAGQKAVAINFVGLTGTPSIALDGTPFYHSPQLSAKQGAVIYVALLDASVEAATLDHAENYTTVANNAESVIFADTNEDGQVNAQDALNALAAWLRKTEAPQGKEILVMNVTGDPRIDTYDPLSMIEHIINGTDFAVMGK